MAWIEQTGQHTWRVRYPLGDGRYGSVSGLPPRKPPVTTPTTSNPTGVGANGSIQPPPRSPCRCGQACGWRPWTSKPAPRRTTAPTCANAKPPPPSTASSPCSPCCSTTRSTNASFRPTASTGDAAVAADATTPLHGWRRSSLCPNTSCRSPTRPPCSAAPPPDYSSSPPPGPAAAGANSPASNATTSTSTTAPSSSTPSTVPCTNPPRPVARTTQDPGLGPHHHPAAIPHRPATRAPRHHD
jgi:hypothetical protein